LHDSHYVLALTGLCGVSAGPLLPCGLPVILCFPPLAETDMNLFPFLPVSFRSLIRWTLEKVAGAIAVCTPLQEAMLQVGIWPREKALVIGNGVDCSAF